MVVRWSMSLDLLDRLIADIVSVTQTLIESDGSEAGSATTSHANPSVEKQHSSQGLDGKQRHKARAPMSDGVHRSVC